MPDKISLLNLNVRGKEVQAKKYAHNITSLDRKRTR